MVDAESLYPLEVVVQGTPVSLQSDNAGRKAAWKRQVYEAARRRQRETDELGWLDDRALAITIYYFSNAPMEGDVDNIVKLIGDALIGVAYRNDKVVERVTVQKFEPNVEWEFSAASDQLALALELTLEKGLPVVYIRVDDDLSWWKA